MSEIIKVINENQIKTIVILSGILVIVVTLFSFGFYRDVETPSIYIEVEPEPEITPSKDSGWILDKDNLISLFGLAFIIFIAKDSIDKW